MGFGGPLTYEQGHAGAEQQDETQGGDHLEQKLVPFDEWAGEPNPLDESPLQPGD